MLVIGLVGGIASGKSRVAEMFQQLGAEVIRADQLGHQVLEQPDVRRSLQERWGESVFLQNGKVDRGAVGRLVFSGTPAGSRDLKFLESVTHPRIAELMRQQLRELEHRGDVPAVVLDAAILLEAGWRPLCDTVLFVEADREQRLERAYRRGWSPAELSARESAQLSLEEKRKLADGVIDNSGSLDHTFAQIQQFWHALDLSPPS